jgi:hypothetical protein
MAMLGDPVEVVIGVDTTSIPTPPAPQRLGTGTGRA